MTTLILLDTGVLGFVTHPSDTPERRACIEWLKTLLEKDLYPYVPEIADYELRRKLLHLGSSKAVVRLDELKSTFDYIPITTDAMLKAAEIWADARRAGVPTAEEAALDVDVILAAQAVLAGRDGQSAVVVATTNVGHLSRFVEARRWQDIT